MTIAEEMLRCAQAIQERNKRALFARAESLYNDVLKRVREVAATGGTCTVMHLELPEGTVLLLKAEGFRVTGMRDNYWTIEWSEPATKLDINA